MSSVSGRVKEVKQPRGGYIRRTDFYVDKIADSFELKKEENIHVSLVGLVVDYMTRFLLGVSKEKAFEIPLLGAEKIKDPFSAYRFLSKINGINSQSIINACKLVGYDVCARVGIENYKPVEEICPDESTIENIRIMLKRCMFFWEKYGPVVQIGLKFTSDTEAIITTGDCDYLTENTLWDFKVLKKEILPRHTLQLLVYYIMGCRSDVSKEFERIQKIGIFNPRQNKAYLLDVSKIPQNTIDLVSREVIGYGKSETDYVDSSESSRHQVEHVFTNSFSGKSTLVKHEDDDALDRELFGFSSKREYIARAFPSKINCNDDIFFERTPTFWKGSTIPSVVFQKKLPYIVRFKSRFSIKKGEVPFVMNKTTLLYSINEPLKTSAFFNYETNQYCWQYVDSSGNIVEPQPVLILTKDDFELFKSVYFVFSIEILDGCYFT